MSFSIGLFLAYLLSILLIVGLPAAAIAILIKRFKVKWWLFLVGLGTYVVSQVIYYFVIGQISKLFTNGLIKAPSENWLPLFNAVILGFLLALFEEGIRYFGLLLVRKKVKKFPSALGVGVAHGGIEAIAKNAWPFWPLYGVFIIQFLQILFFNAGSVLAKGVSLEVVQNTLNYISYFWAQPFHIGLQPGIEALIGFITQVAFTLLVWKAVRRRNFSWFGLAFLYHFLFQFATVYLVLRDSDKWVVLGIMSVFILLSGSLIWYLLKESIAKTKASLDGNRKSIEEDNSESEMLSDDQDAENEDSDVDDDDDDDDDDDNDDSEDEDDNSVESVKKKAPKGSRTGTFLDDLE